MGVGLGGFRVQNATKSRNKLAKGEDGEKQQRTNNNQLKKWPSNDSNASNPLITGKVGVEAWCQ